MSNGIEIVDKIMIQLYMIQNIFYTPDFLYFDNS